MIMAKVPKMHVVRTSDSDGDCWSVMTMAVAFVESRLLLRCSGWYMMAGDIVLYSDVWKFLYC